MFAAAAAGTFSGAGAAFVFAFSAVCAGMFFCIKVAAAGKECLTFPAGKNGFGLFIKTQTGGGISPLFIRAAVADKVAVCNFFSVPAKYGDAVRNIVMAFSAVFAFAVFLFRGNRLLL